MKTNILKLAALVGIITASGISAKDFFLTNNTPFPAQTTWKWAGCSTDNVGVNPGQRIKVDGAACLLTEISASVQQSGSATLSGVTYQAQYTGTVMNKVNNIVTARPYSSSGQSHYTEFHLMGPGINGAYHVGRFVQ